MGISQVESSIQLATFDEYVQASEIERNQLVLEADIMTRHIQTTQEVVNARMGMDNAVSQLTFRKNLEREKRQVKTASNLDFDDDNDDNDKDKDDDQIHNDNDKTMDIDVKKLNRNTCNICLCVIDDNDEVVLPCGHGYDYHRDCLSDWLRCHSTCPECRQKVHSSDIQVARVDKNMGVVIRPKVIGEWGTKVDTLVSDVIELMNSNDDEKCIVFSQWKEMFHLVGSAFKKNNIKFEVCQNKADFSTKGPLQRFKHDMKIRVLLLLLSHGSHGLTLTEASHVYLLEPIMNVQQEAQTINRVHRIGQTRTTYVHKYIINDTVEKRIHEMTESILNDTEGGALGVVNSIAVEQDHRKQQQRSPKKDKSKKNNGLSVLGGHGNDVSDSINLTLSQVKSLLGNNAFSSSPSSPSS